MTAAAAGLVSDTRVMRRGGAADLDRVVAMQRAAYAQNRALLGREPLPLLADYARIFATMEVWLAETDGRLDGVLILERRPDDLLIWSVATDPARQAAGLGRRMLAAAEARAREIGITTMRLYTGTALRDRVAWYGRHGYVVESIDESGDRSITHMVKPLA